MNVDQVVVITSDIKGQKNLQASTGTDVSGQANSRANEGKASPNDLVTITKAASGQGDKAAGPQANKTNVSSQPVLLGIKGVIALDDDKNVVIRFFDKNGKIVQQYPPEEYLQMMKELNQVTESLFHKKV